MEHTNKNTSYEEWKAMWADAGTSFLPKIYHHRLWYDIGRSVEDMKNSIQALRNKEALTPQCQKRHYG